jgi:hypothetical protein
MITRAELVKGGLVAVSDIDGVFFPIEPVGTRNIALGTQLISGWGSFNNYGTCVGAFDVATGVFTAPQTGWYDLTILFTLAVSGTSNFNNLTGGPNPNGFMGTAGLPPSTAGAFPVVFSDYFGVFGVALTDPTGGLAYCYADKVVTYDTSVIQLSATYTGRKINAGTEIWARTLNKTKNIITGVNGNSYHLSVTHLR